MVIWRKLKNFFRLVGMAFGLLGYRLLVGPLGLFKVNKEIKDLEEPAGPTPAPCELTVDAKVIEAKIDPLIYGTFIEVLAKCIYGGIWDEYNKNVPLIHGGLRKDVLDETRALKATIIRWPGGCFSDVYNWKEGIGPRDQRRKENNRHWHWFGPRIGPKHDNHFGTDEFMQFIKEVGAEPYVNINFGTGTAEEAAQWVEYMNGDESTEYGALRAKNGHPEPYNVKYWGIANEIYGIWEPGHTTPEDYARRYLEFAEAMQTVDLSIKLIAVGAGFEYPEWNRNLLEIAGDKIDYLSHHVYVPGIVTATMSNTMKNFYNILAGAFEMERRIEWVANSIREVTGDAKKIPISFDEWNVMWNIRQHYEGYYTLRDGLFAASVFEVLHRHAKAVTLATQAQLTNVIPMIVTNDTDVYHNPIYLAFQLFSTYSEQYLLSFKVKCDTRPNPEYGNIAATEIPFLGCSVTTNQAKDRLVIIGINRHHAHDLPTTISLTNFEPEPTAQVFEMNGPHHSAYNLFDKKEEVTIQEKKFTSISKKFNYTFPAHSVTTLILQKRA